MLISCTTHGHAFTVELDDDDVTITQDNVWAGSGRWTGLAIEDCAATLGDGDPDVSEKVYDVLDIAVAAALDSTTDPTYFVTFHSTDGLAEAWQAEQPAERCTVEEVASVCVEEGWTATLHDATGSTRGTVQVDGNWRLS